MSTLPAVTKGGISRQDFGSMQVQTSSETAMAGVAAREEAKIKAMYVMAERHLRSWDTVRVRLLEHCGRTGFAEIARYKKPTGKKKVNGKWIDTYAEGLSVRFAEIARQEMGNTWCSSNITYEDDLIRIVEDGVVDLERNNNDSRSISIAKAVEKRGKKRDDDTWDPPEGREVIGNPRINSYGDPVWLVKATDDEIRARQNSEISKAQRDESLRLIPKDIRDDCEARILAVLADPKKNDPTAARKKVIDAFAGLGVLPDELVTYAGCPLEKMAPHQLDELRGLWSAINEGEITFDKALQMKYDQPQGTSQERDAVVDKKIRELEKKEGPLTQETANPQSQAVPVSDAVPIDDSKDPEVAKQIAEEQARKREKPVFGRPK
jgi:hypothetical protein